MMKQTKNIPELRFPEFEGEWKLYEIQEHFDLISGQHLNPDEYTNDSTSNLIPYFTGPSDFTNDEEKLVKWSLNSGKQAQQNDILITVKGNGVGTLMLLKLTKVVIGRQLMAIREKSGLNAFLVNILEKRKQYFEALASGNLIPGLTRNDILTTEDYFPSIPEQQKIASFLSAADQRLQLLTQKKEKLEQYKKSIMQQIFSQQLRFKDEKGQEYPEWEEKKISEVFTITRGYVLSFAEIIQEKDEKYKYPVYSSQTKNNGLSGYYYKSLYSNAITWTTDGANAGEVKYREGEFYCTNVCGVLISNHGYANECIATMLNAVTKKYVSYVGNPKLMNNVMGNISIKFPSNDEQQKISTFLSSIDQKITLVNQQIELTRKWKQGLLQKMFV